MPKVVVSGAEYWDFEKNPKFVGKFVAPFLRENDDQIDPDKKKGDVIGFIHEDANGDMHIIGNSHQVHKALTSEGIGIGSVMGYEFLGKTENGKGQPVNRYKVLEYVAGDTEYEVFNPKPKA